MVFFDSFLYNGCMDKKKLLLIDGSSVAFRAFFALYQQLDRFKNAAGLHTNAIYGFQLMLSHLLERVEPSHILVAFDAGKTTFRTEMYADYKGGRAKTPDEFREQFPFIRELLDHMGIRHYELAQYEADDIIGTLDKLAEQDGFDITIVSGDKDLIQLTDEHTVVEISKKGVAEFEAFTPDYLMEEMGLTPAQFIDLKALMGDKSDNIPGVTKVGEKTGIKLLLEHGSLEGIYENIDGMKTSKMKENLINDKEQAFLSKTLATIDTKAPIAIGLEDLVYSGPDVENLGKFYDEMGFKQLKQALNVSSADVAEGLDFTIVDQISQDMLSEESIFHFELFGENYHTDNLVGFAWSCGDKLYATDKLELLQDPIFKDFLEKTSLRVYDFKKVKVLLQRFGVDLQAPAFDIRLAKYLLSTVEDNEIATIASLYGQTYLVDDETFYGKGVKKAIPEREKFLEHLACKLAVLVETEPVLLEKLSENGQLELLYDMEQPLAFVLAKMEIAGIVVKKETLLEMQAENELVIEKLTQEIYELAGEEFNVNSPKQLGVLLFEKLGLPLEYTKKTKTGYSTAVDVLERPLLLLRLLRKSWITVKLLRFNLLM
ncbi:DNA polymerase I - 3'-5' exonuclease and polymerase domains [Streptococcus pneumoniae]|nr:DNA polymerase I - 3'-5' exonuclease and polymerase domains [Streptococcus pneumoniae]